MRLNSSLLFSALFLLGSSILYAHVHNPALLARLSYDNSGAMQTDQVRHICVAVFQGGNYRVVRSLDDKTQRLQGKMSKEQLEELKTLLISPEFRSLKGTHGGLVRQDAEIFGAEIPMPGLQREDRSWRSQWQNGDGENPFPASMAKVVNWLQHFEPTNGKHFERTEFQDVCPSGGLRTLQPETASLRP